MADAIRLDYHNCMKERIGETGLERTDLEHLRERLEAVRGEVEAELAGGKHGYLKLPEQDLSPILDYARSVSGAFQDLVVIGIGGSSLGAIALHQALNHPQHNALPPGRRRGAPRLHFLENSDPDTSAALLDTLDPKGTLAVVVTKSGSTSETIANFMLVHEWMRAAGVELSRNMAAVTDPEKGDLLAFARKSGMSCFVVPPAVGGRFSVLSPVGLLPAALTGIDVGALLAGAGRALERWRDGGWCPASAYAALHYLFDRERNIRISVVMPYADQLDRVGDWYRQLWAESLGKRRSTDGREVFEGPTPIRALGAIDQHSQVQLYVEGPRDKLVTFIRVEDKAGRGTIPGVEGLPAGLAYLSGHRLGELLNAEQVATAYALAEAGRPSLTFRLESVNAESVGELLMTFQLATSLAGKLYGVDPYDQPGVEAGKRAAYALMGRAGYEQHAEEIRAKLGDSALHLV